ncbi:hypothetical protein Pla100_10940 [Neorhodopirellula pilleata]|uniref:Uncharacterized protein n=1 Tax=Neorhodopirellula pilleata TaxID=2714738 RepID=A0A5C6APD3_9BACT|nr:hypothetical protein Pla100_10940 [Neorhodopirellula pilleata]
MNRSRGYFVGMTVCARVHYLGLDCRCILELESMNETKKSIKTRSVATQTILGGRSSWSPAAKSSRIRSLVRIAQ